MPNFTNQDMIDQWSTVTPQSIDDYGDEGDLSKKYLLNPAIFELLGDIQNKRVLEVGMGGGYLSRLMAKKGAKVIGLEPSKSMYQYAVDKEQKEHLGIEFINSDLSQMNQFNNEFDVVVSNMVFLDIPDWKPAMRNCIQALKPGGKFVFSLWHPCYFSNDSWKDKGVVEVKEYFQEYSVPATYGSSFHRTLSTYLNFVIENGCNIKKIIEPQLTPEQAEQFPKISQNLHIPTFIVILTIKD